MVRIISESKKFLEPIISGSIFFSHLAEKFRNEFQVFGPSPIKLLAENTLEPLTQKVSYLEEQTSIAHKNFRAIAGRFTRFDRRTEVLEERLERIETRLDGVEHKLERVDLRLEHVGQRLSLQEGRMQRVEQRLDESTKQLQETMLTLQERIAIQSRWTVGIMLAVLMGFISLTGLILTVLYKLYQL